MVDPKKLEAFANPGGLPKGKGGGAPPQPEPKEPEGDDEEGGNEQEGEPESGGGLAEKYGDLIEMLESNAEQVEEQLEMLDQAALTDPGDEDEDFKAAVNESLGSLDQALVDLMREHLKGVSWDDAMDIAEHLADEGHVAEPEPFAGFLFHAGHVL